ncbi:MAG: hypothetical protein A2698_00805 [Candidatus Levybacteria bacterium RIFCSPHIGHO2_01_FULL_42_15]|nr:MAG: hypothetical protein A2698_00805 [Candidatus Levybacteria bacterium RIFCSPHIGHO2_01_FULL_42_15]OGH42951.1 MAG: hypothetical protein A3B53_00745 [Candidatus Levybacteria bacterium RIFCSPLOWO2_01_FULL_42_15]
MRFNLFKTFKLTWWQASLFKLSAVSFGVIISPYFQDLFRGIEPFLWILLIVSGLYIAYIWLKQ